MTPLGRASQEALKPRKRLSRDKANWRNKAMDEPATFFAVSPTALTRPEFQKSQ
jgi:hypothetical protein